MQTLTEPLVLEDSPCPSSSTITTRTPDSIVIVADPPPTVIADPAPDGLAARWRFSSPPTAGQVRVLVAMVSLVVVHSTAVALYVLGG